MSRANKPDPVQGLEVYVVGGAVRDALLGLASGDRDWVVVGASPEDMSARGFTPVGEDFPVFLHPYTHEEYALARTERKSGRGYHGFVFYAGSDVSLEDDLRRRDLTVNAIARAPTGELLDPLGGIADIKAKVLRHTGPAFAEDPVRLLRLARFAARFSDFTIAPETLALCEQLVANGEVDALVPERVWQEFAKGLMSAAPARMLAVLRQCGALQRVASELVYTPELGYSLDLAARRGLALEQRYALMCQDSAALLQKQLKAPRVCQDMALLLPGVLKRLRAMRAVASGSASAATSLELFAYCDAFRRAPRCLALIQAAACVIDAVNESLWQQRLAAVATVDAGAIARQADGAVDKIKGLLRDARLQALKSVP